MVIAQNFYASHRNQGRAPRSMHRAEILRVSIRFGYPSVEVSWYSIPIGSFLDTLHQGWINVICEVNQNLKGQKQEFDTHALNQSFTSALASCGFGMDGEKGGCGVEWGDVEMFLPKKFIISCVVCRAFLDQRRVAFFPPLWLPPLSFSTFPTLTAFCTFAPRRVFVLALGFLPFDWGAHGRGTTRRRPTISFSRLWGVGCIVYLPFCAM